MLTLPFLNGDVVGRELVLLLQMFSARDLVEIGGAVFGMAGAALLSINCKYSRWGWVLFLISNVFWIGFGIVFGHKGFTVQQVFFMLTSSIGVYRWVIRPLPVVAEPVGFEVSR